jgi:hypothetical protein
VSGQELNLIVQSTRVAGSNFFPMLDGIVVPVKDIVERVRGSGATSVAGRVTYIDSGMRITRTQDGEVFVYLRVP